MIVEIATSQFRYLSEAENPCASEGVLFSALGKIGGSVGSLWNNALK